MTCEMELCPRWGGDGRVCDCVLAGRMSETVYALRPEDVALLGAVAETPARTFTEAFHRYRAGGPQSWPEAAQATVAALEAEVAALAEALTKRTHEFVPCEYGEPQWSQPEWCSHGWADGDVCGVF